MERRKSGQCECLVIEPLEFGLRVADLVVNDVRPRDVNGVRCCRLPYLAGEWRPPVSREHDAAGQSAGAPSAAVRLLISRR